MNHLFREIDSQPPPLGEISLRCRRIPVFGDRDIYEVKLGDEFLMSSMLFDAILLDIDHAPRTYLHAPHGDFYTHENLAKMMGQFRDGGVFAIWPNEPPDDVFMSVLRSVFWHTDSHVVRFHNLLQNNEAANTVYLARKLV